MEQPDKTLGNCIEILHHFFSLEWEKRSALCSPGLQPLNLLDMNFSSE